MFKQDNKWSQKSRRVWFAQVCGPCLYAWPFRTEPLMGFRGPGADAVMGHTRTPTTLDRSFFHVDIAVHSQATAHSNSNTSGSGERAPIHASSTIRNVRTSDEPSSYCFNAHLLTHGLISCNLEAEEFWAIWPWARPGLYFMWDENMFSEHFLRLPVGYGLPCPFVGWYVEFTSLGVLMSPASRSADETSSTLTCNTKSKLLTLPVELISMIFDDIDDFDTMVYFCICHSYIGAVCEPKINELMMSELAPWAGKPLACIGSLSDDTYPPQMEPYVRSAKLSWLRDAGRTRNLAGRTSESDASKGHDITFLKIICARYKHWRYKVYTGQTVINCYAVGQHHDHDAMLADQRKVEKLVDGWDAVNEYPDLIEQHEVLCNLSKGVFISFDAIQELNNSFRQQLGYWHGFGNITIDAALLAMITWSTEVPQLRHCSEDIRKRLTSGPWAGDRFELTTLERVRKDIAWRDVTAEVVEWVDELFEAYCDDGVVEDLNGNH